jgi:hypothetical protein
MLLVTLVVYIHFVASKRAIIEQLAKNLCREKIPQLFVMYTSTS